MMEGMKLFRLIRDYLVGYEDLMFRGKRLVILKTWRKGVLEQIHGVHMSTASCLNRARETVCWPEMSQHVKGRARKCTICESKQRDLKGNHCF